MRTTAAAGEPTPASAAVQPPLSDADIICLARQQPPQANAPLPSFLLSPHSHSTLVSFLVSRSSSSIAAAEYTSSLLSLIPLSPPNPSLSSLLDSLLLSYVNLFTSRKLPHDRNSLKTIHHFALHLDKLTGTGLKSSSQSILEGLSQIFDPDDAQLLDLLPRCLDLIRHRSDEMEGGIDHVDSAIDCIISCDWSNALLVKMVSLLKELSFLDKSRVSEFLEKVFVGMKGLELQDLPSLVYQLLVLASKGFSKREVIEGVVMFFGSEMGFKGTSAARQVEGTVLLHVNFAVKQDPSLGQEVMGVVKSDLRAFNHFTVAILLSVARVPRFADASMGILKKALLSAYADYKITKDHKWLPDDLKEEYLQRVKLVEKAVLRAVKDSHYGREHIVPCIVRFGFLVLESAQDGNCTEPRKLGLMGIEELGIQMLRTLFEVHEMARNEIIEQCKFQILSLKPEQSMSTVRLLGDLAQNFPHPMLDYVSRLKDLLDYFTFMPSKIATHLVTALSPLLKFSRDLQDYTILVLRKAMFRREDAVRIAATSSIIDLILVEKKSRRNALINFQESASQASCSQQTEIPSNMNNGLFEEFNGLLQRCLYQQAKVKEVMYQGIVKIVLVDSSAAWAVFDFLVPHFKKFYKEDADVQLGIRSCIKSGSGKVFCEEPLDSLLSCMSWISLLQSQDETDKPPDSSWPCFGFALSQDNESGKFLSAKYFTIAFSNIRKLLRRKNLEGILGQMQDEDTSDEEKGICVSILSGIIEVVLNIVAVELEKAEGAKKLDLENELVGLVDFYNLIENSTSTSRRSTGIKRRKLQTVSHDKLDNVDFGQRKPFLSTSSTQQLLQTALELVSIKCSGGAATSDISSMSSVCNIAESSSKILSFVLNVSLRLTTSFSFAEKDDLSNTLIYGNISMLGPPLLKLIWLLQSGTGSVMDQREKDGKARKQIYGEHMHSALLCLKELLKINKHSTNLFEDLVVVSTEYAPAGEDESGKSASGVDDRNSRSKELFVQKAIKPLLTELLAQSSFHEIEALCEMLLLTANELPSEWRTSHGAWAVRICQSNAITNSKVATSMVRLSFSLSPSPVDIRVAQNLTVELLKFVKKAAQSELERSETYLIISKATDVAIASSILHFVETVISDIEWGSMRLKTFFSTSLKSIPSDEINGEHNHVLAFEDNLYSRAEGVVNIFSSFVLMRLEDSQAEQFLRLTAKFYKQLARITKVHIPAKGCKQVIPSLQFQKVVELTCKQLTSPLYNFVAEMQKDQQESTKTKGIINKIKRENKCIPDLIYQIEDYENFLIQLSNASKVNLLRHAKRSTARDFKILDLPTDEDDNARNVEAANNDGEAANNEDETAAQSESCEESDRGESGSDRVLSPGPHIPLAAEDSASDTDGDAPHCNSKRAKMSIVVQGSEDEA